MHGGSNNPAGEIDGSVSIAAHDIARPLQATRRQARSPALYELHAIKDMRDKYCVRADPILRSL